MEGNNMENSTEKIEYSQAELTIANFRLFDGKNQTRAFLDLQFGPFLMRGFALVENRDGRSYFVSPPSKLGTGSDGSPKNFDYILVDRGFQAKLIQMAVARYKAAKK